MQKWGFTYWSFRDCPMDSPGELLYNGCILGWFFSNGEAKCEEELGLWSPEYEKARPYICVFGAK
jgi:hypothetical protein